MQEFQEAIYEKYLKYVSPYNQIGKTFTSLGPSPYIGNILEYDDLLWTEDIWTIEKEEFAKQKLEQQTTNTVSSYWRNNYIFKANTYWHHFYQRNTTKFYKDRHYLHIVFPELLCNATQNQDSIYSKYLLEVGCGVGNAIIPLIELNPNLHIIAMDFAKSAIDILNQHPYTYATTQYNTTKEVLITKHIDISYPIHHNDSNTIDNDIIVIDNEVNNNDNIKNLTVNSNSYQGTTNDHDDIKMNRRRIRTALCDIVKDQLPVESSSMDLVLCMFVLSAISPDQQFLALQQLSKTMRTGAKLLIRDYGRYDEAQLRFKKGSKLSDNFYVRQDGTCSYFFTLEQLHIIGNEVGLAVEESYYIRRQYANRQQKQARHRIWIHIKFIKL